MASKMIAPAEWQRIKRDYRFCRNVSDFEMPEECRAHSDWQRVFKKEFISSRMKMLKPSREIFDAAAAEIGLPPEEILFIDDSQTNVDGALAAGWQAGLYVQGTDLGACVKKFI